MMSGLAVQETDEDNESKTEENAAADPVIQFCSDPVPVFTLDETSRMPNIDEVEDDEDSTPIMPRRVFAEMVELTGGQWRETARWLRFIETVDTGSNRWSKPHVAALSLPSLFNLKKHLQNDVVMLNCKRGSYYEVAERVVEWMESAFSLTDEQSGEIHEHLMKRYTHQFQHQRYPRFRDANQESSIASIPTTNMFQLGREFAPQLMRTSSQNFDGQLKRQVMFDVTELGIVQEEYAQSTASSDETQVTEISEENSITGNLWKNIGSKYKKVKNLKKGGGADDLNYKGDICFLKKIPKDAEVCNVIVGECSSVQRILTVFLRFDESVILKDVTEVLVPTRFMFFVFYPRAQVTVAKELGKAMGTIISDEVFSSNAYRSRKREELVENVTKFVEEVTVLPPGEWDPSIRIEPPSSIPAAESRMVNISSKQRLISEGEDGEEETEEKEEKDTYDQAFERTGRLFGGLVNDVKRKFPLFMSDFYDGFNLKSVATFFFLFFAVLPNVVAFGGMLEEATDGHLAVMETILSAAVSGCIYHLFSGQPLSTIGPASTILAFEATIFTLSRDLGLNFLSLRFWIGVHTAILLMIVVATDGSAMVKYVTRFTEETFTFYLAAMFIFGGTLKTFQTGKAALHVAVYNSIAGAACRCHQTTNTSIPGDSQLRYIHRLINTGQNITWFQNGLISWDVVPLTQCQRVGGTLIGSGCHLCQESFIMSIVLMFGTFVIAHTLKGMRSASIFNATVRGALSDFAVFIAVMAMCALSYLSGIYTPVLNVPSEFRPTRIDRGWLVHPFDGNPWWTVLLAIPPAVLLSILMFMDQQITGVVVNRRENKLQKGCGYHLDLFVYAIIILICSTFGFTFWVAATMLSMTHVNALKVFSDCTAPGEKPKLKGVKEQRLTGVLVFLAVGLSILIPEALRLIPVSVVYAVPVFMGICAVKNLQMTDRIMLFITPMRYQPESMYIRHVPIQRIKGFTLIQLLCLALLLTIKSIKVISMVFPVVLVLMLGIRKLIERWFSEQDLMYLDNAMPEFTLRKNEDRKRSAGSKKMLAISKTYQNLQSAITDGFKKSAKPPEQWNRQRATRRNALALTEMLY